MRHPHGPDDERFTADVSELQTRGADRAGREQFEWSTTQTRSNQDRKAWGMPPTTPGCVSQLQEGEARNPGVVMGVGRENYVLPAKKLDKAW
jgi:hypothetical protein